MSPPVFFIAGLKSLLLQARGSDKAKHKLKIRIWKHQEDTLSKKGHLLLCCKERASLLVFNSTSTPPPSTPPSVFLMPAFKKNTINYTHEEFDQEMLLPS